MIFQLDLFDLRNILDSVNQPSVIIDTTTEKIITGNYLFSEITGYSTNEISGVNYKAIFNDLMLANVIDGGELKTTLNIKSKEQITLNLVFKYISNINKILLVKLEDSSKSRLIANPGDQFSSAIIDVLTSFQDNSFDQIYKNILDIWINNALGDDAVIYFRNKENKNLLNLISIKNSCFPEHLPVIELERITELDIWQPGKRVLSEIHRAGRTCNFQIIYLFPLINENEPFGLFISGFKSKVRDNNLDNLIILFSSIINTLLQHYKKYSDLKSKYDEQLSAIEKYLVGFENSNEGIVVLDWNNQILEFNSKFQKIVEYSPIELFNKNARQIFGNTEIMRFINENQESGNNIAEKQVILLDRFGNSKHVLIRLFQMGDNSKKRKIVFILDKSEFNILQESLSKLEKQAEIGETLSEFAHDVRNIINRQTTGIQLLAKKQNLSLDEDIQISGLMDDCNELTETMDSILSLSRQKPDNFEKIKLNEFIQRIIYRNKHKTERFDVDVQLIDKCASTMIFGDQRSLERAFLNIINNGIEAIKDEGGLVSINLLEADGQPDYLTVKIADTGPGIPVDLTGQLFTNQISDKPKGTGLGLLISQKIIKSHKGWIDVESFPGGTIFSIFLPKVNEGDIK